MWLLARPGGFEPTTNGIGIRYSIRTELRADVFEFQILIYRLLFLKKSPREPPKLGFARFGEPLTPKNF